MRPMRWLTCLAIAGLIAACDSIPTDSQAGDPPLTPTVDRLSQTFGWLDAPYTGFIECANDGQGELMDWYGEFSCTVEHHITPSGNNPRANRCEFSGLPEDHLAYMGPDYVLIGQESGDVFVLDNKKSKFLEKRLNKEEGTWGYHQTMNLFLESAEGEKLHVQGTYQMKVVDGEWKMYHVNRGSCPEIC